MLRIASGDIIDVDTLLTNTPQGLAGMGVRRRSHPGVAQGRDHGVPARQPESRARRPHPDGPGVRRRRRTRRRARGEDPLDRSADRLRLQRLQRASSPPPTAAQSRSTMLKLDRQGDDVGVPAGHRHSAEAVLREHGRGARAGTRAREQQPARPPRGQHRQSRARRGIDADHSRVRARRVVRGRRRPCRAGRRRSGSDGDRNVTARPAAAHGPQGPGAQMAARGDGHRLHHDGDRSGSHGRH